MEIKEEIWEVPELFPFDEFASIGYDKEISFLFKFKSEKLLSDSLMLKCDISWLICKEGCYSGYKQMECNLTKARSEIELNKFHDIYNKIIDKSSIPLKQYAVDTKIEGKIILLKIESQEIDFQNVKSAILLSDEIGKIETAGQISNLGNDSLSLIVAVDEDRINLPKNIIGILILIMKNGTSIGYEIEFKI